MSLKYDSHDLYILKRMTENGQKVWIYALVHEMKRRGTFYYWTPGCTNARRISNQLLNDPNTLRQRYVCNISSPHLNDFIEVMATDWQAARAQGDRDFMCISLIELERLRIIPDGTQSHWVNVLTPEYDTPPTSDSSSLPSSGGSSGSSGSSSSESGFKGTSCSGRSATSRGRGGHPSHPFSSPGSNPSGGRHANRTRAPDPGTRKDQGAMGDPPTTTGRGAKRDPPAREDPPAKRYPPGF
jgi:hypothetical protein